jgi:hypothetical protein
MSLSQESCLLNCFEISAVLLRYSIFAGLFCDTFMSRLGFESAIAVVEGQVPTPFLPTFKKHLNTLK